MRRWLCVLLLSAAGTAAASPRSLIFFQVFCTTSITFSAG